MYEVSMTAYVEAGFRSGVGAAENVNQLPYWVFV